MFVIPRATFIKPKPRIIFFYTVTVDIDGFNTTTFHYKTYDDAQKEYAKQVKFFHHVVDNFNIIFYDILNKKNLGVFNQRMLQTIKNKI